MESLPLFEGDFEFEIFEEHVSTGLCSGDFLFAFASVGADDDKSFKHMDLSTTSVH